MPLAQSLAGAHPNVLGHRPDPPGGPMPVACALVHQTMSAPVKHALAAIVVLAAFVPAFPAFPAADDTVVRPIHRVDPEFPRWAFRAGVNHGIVSARLTVDADGRVTAVEIVHAEPQHLFDQAVAQAL